MTPSTKHPSAGFGNAASNQIVFDKFYYGMAGLNYKDYHGIPRPTKWAANFKQVLGIIKFASWPLSVLWAYAFFYIWIFYSAVLLAASVNYNKRKPPLETLSCKSVGLLVCDRSHAVLQRSESPQVDFWLLPLGASASAEGANIQSCSEILSGRELLNCIAHSIMAHRSLIKTRGLSAAFQTYAVWSWVVTWTALKNLSPTLISTSEHHDRWAVLVDFYCSSTAENNGCQMALTQHGNEYESTYESMAEFNDGEGLPYKLKSVSVLNVYNQEQQNIFFRHILCNPNEVQTTVNLIGHKIFLAPPTKGEEAGILIVGHRVCENFHLEIWRNMSNRTHARVYYKPHPTVSASTKAKSATWHFISDTEFYPRALFIISYPSTLISEYASEGIPAIEHGIDAQAAQAGEVMGLINERLRIYGLLY